MRKHLKESIIIFVAVIAVIVIFLQGFLGSNYIYSMQSIKSGDYSYESDDFSISTTIDCYEEISKLDLIHLFNYARPLFSNVSDNYHMSVCEFDDEYDRMCKQLYDPASNGNLAFSEVPMFRVVDENGNNHILINAYKLEDETNSELFVRNVVNSISDQSLQNYLVEAKLSELYNNYRDAFANTFGADHVSDLNHFLREGMVRFCVSKDVLTNEFKDYYVFLKTYLFTSKNNQTVLSKNSFIDKSVNDDSIEEEQVEETVETSDSQENTPSIVGYWKYEQFPDVPSSDTCTYMCFNDNGTFEAYTNPGPQFAQHCVNKQSGTYSLVENVLVLDVSGQTRWTYGFEWIDTDHFDRTYVKHVDSFERVSDQEFMTYYS